MERPAAGEFAVADLPLVIHELRQGGELLFDAAEFDRNGWVAYVVPAIGGSVAMAGLGLFALSFALGARARG